jgi:hypothetical protein
MHERARFPVLLAAVLLSFPVCAARAAGRESVPWQLHGPADVKCDQDGERARQRFWEAADWGAVPGYRERLVTTRPVRPLGFWAGRSVCFENVVFAVNPRSAGTGKTSGTRHVTNEDAFVAQVAEAVRRVRSHPASPFRKAEASGD